MKWPFIEVRSVTQPYLGLAHLITGVWWWRQRRPTSEPRLRLAYRVPFGWRAYRLRDMDARLIMPLWLYALVMLHEHRYGYYLALRSLMRLGLWSVANGDLYTDGRWTCPRPIARFLWCFVHDRDTYPYTARGEFIARMERIHGPLGGTWGISSKTFTQPRFSDRPIHSAPFNGLTPREYEAAKVRGR